MQRFFDYAFTYAGAARRSRLVATSSTATPGPTTRGFRFPGPCPRQDEGGHRPHGRRDDGETRPTRISRRSPNVRARRAARRSSRAARCTRSSGWSGDTERFQCDRVEADAGRRSRDPDRQGLQDGRARPASRDHDGHGRAPCRSGATRSRSSRGRARWRTTEQAMIAVQGGEGRRRHDPARRRLQAEDLAVLVPGTRRARARDPRGGAAARPACRSSWRSSTSRRWSTSPRSRTASASARATRRTSSCCKEVGLANKPVMLKRGLAMTIEEWLQAAEYVAQRGNSEIILCERGIRTFEPSTRNTLDLAGMAVAQARVAPPGDRGPVARGGEAAPGRAMALRCGRGGRRRRDGRRARGSRAGARGRRTGADAGRDHRARQRSWPRWPRPSAAP